MSNRSVATDALATLGTIIDETQKRDAIHLAVEPVIAGMTLAPGRRITVRDGVAWAKADETALGIVDPFLSAPVKKGERFWFIMMPRMITSLRHVWAHPAFPDEAGTPAPADDPVSKSRAWINDFAAKIDQTPNRLMEAAELWLDTYHEQSWGGSGEYTYDNSESYKDHWDAFPEFWSHYAVVTGKDVPEKARKSFFTCSC